MPYCENDLARIDRGLYGANLHYQTTDTTSFGEKRFAVDGFSAQPGTVAMREHRNQTASRHPAGETRIAARGEDGRCSPFGR